MTTHDLTQARIGIDIGRVLMCPTTEQDGPDTSFLAGNLEQALSIPPANLSLDVVRHLVETTEGRVWLVSKAGKRIRERTQQWFVRHDFFASVGMQPNQVHFCFKRHEKRPIAEQLRLTHFIDDRVDVLGHLRSVVSHLLLFGVQDQPAPDWTIHVRDWRAVYEHLYGQAFTKVADVT